MSTNPELFPAIGSVVEQTEKLPVEAQTVEVTLDEERPVQEIESLCMRCEDQVRPLLSYGWQQKPDSFYPRVLLDYCSQQSRISGRSL